MTMMIAAMSGSPDTSIISQLHPFVVAQSMQVDQILSA